MKELKYSILRYAPSLVSGETINLAALFYYPDSDYRELYIISNWNRVSAFDDALSIPVIKDVLLDIKDAVGTTLSNPHFNMQYLCAQYNSELHFDKPITLQDVSADELSNQIEDIKKMYFQFELDKSKRPSKKEQKRFLQQLLKAQQIEYIKNDQHTGKYADTITYDYTFGTYGIKFFDFELSKLNDNTFNKVKAWAWNCSHTIEERKIIIIYNAVDEQRPDVKAALSILAESAFKTININDGFGRVIDFLEKSVS